MPDATGEHPEDSLIGLALAASALVSSLAAPVLRRGDDGSPFPHVFTRVMDQVVPTVVGSVDVDALLNRVDINALLDRIDVDRMMARVDVQALLDRVDVEALMGRIDLDALLAQVDIPGLLDRIDVAAIAERAEIGELVAQSTRDVAGSTLDLARRQLVALDLLALGLVQRVLHRDLALEAGPASLVGPTESPAGQVTGRYGGPLSRLLAFAIDAFAVVALFGVAANIAVFCVRLILGLEVDTGNTDNPWWLAAYVLWALLYNWVCLAITGRTPGKWLSGLRVVERDGTPLRTRAAFIRVVTLPLSFLLLGLGLIGIVIGRERRALHDVLAGSVVVYDWGDRPAEMPAPLTRWLSRQGTLDVTPSVAPGPPVA